MANHTPQAVSGSSGLTEPPQRSSSPGQRKAPSPGSKCSFQISLPLVGMSRWLLGAPPLTLGSCQESSRPCSLPLQAPFSPCPSSILSLSWTPYETLFSASTGLHALTPPALPSLAAVATVHRLFQVGFLEREGEGTSLLSPQKSGLWVKSSPFQISSHHDVYISPILPLKHIHLKHIHQDLPYIWVFPGGVILSPNDSSLAPVVPLFPTT